MLNILKFQMPKPPSEIGEQTFDQLTKWNLNSSPKPPHKKSRWSFSIRFATLEGIGKRDNKYAGRLERVFFIRITLPPLDRYIRFQLTNRLNLSNTTIPNRLGLKRGPQRKTKVL
jgi:hypothetical protein